MVLIFNQSVLPLNPAFRAGSSGREHRFRYRVSEFLQSLRSKRTFEQQFRISEEIASGSTSTVYLAVEKWTHAKFAVKSLKKSKLLQQQRYSLLQMAGPRSRNNTSDALLSTSKSTGPNQASSAKRRRLLSHHLNPKDILEISILSDLSHPNIVRLNHVFDDPEDDDLHIVLEYVKGGPIMDLSNENRKIKYSEEECRKYFRQLVEAVNYMHQQGIIHGDIKPENILLADDNTIKLTDFGSATRMNTSSEQGVQGAPLSSGTPAFMPPERLKRRHNSCSCSLRHGKTATDVWSMGVTLYCLCYGSLPFKSDSLSKLHDTIQRSSVEYPSNCSEGLRDLLQGMLTKEACKRMSVKDILAHPWLCN